MFFSDLTTNQTRVAVDVKQTWNAYRISLQNAAQYSGGMTWKRVNGVDYLVKITNRTGGNRGLGVRSQETEQIYRAFLTGKSQSKERLAALKRSLTEFSGMSKGVGVNRVPSLVSAILRRFDEYGLLGKNLIVIGTNALYGYESQAGVFFDSGLIATTDVDFLWDSRTKLKLAALDDSVANGAVLAILKKLDKSFDPIDSQPFLAVNNNGFYVDIVRPMPNPPWKKNEPMRIASDALTPSWLENIKWLLSSEKFHSVVIGQDGFPAPMVAPDPRAFGVYKHWLSNQPDREPEKRLRDQQQAKAVIRLVQEKFPHLPLDEKAEQMFPKYVRRLTNNGFSL